MEPALLAGVLLASLAVDAVGHALRVVAVAVVGQHEPGPPGEGHRQVTHGAEMLDLQGSRLVVDGVPAHGPEEIGQRHVDARDRLVVPEHPQHQPRAKLAVGVVGEVPVGHLAGSSQVGQHHLFAPGYLDLVILHVGAGNAVADLVQVVQALRGGPPAQAGRTAPPARQGPRSIKP